MNILKTVLRFRDSIAGGVFWLAELEPFYFWLFVYFYVAMGTFIIGFALLVS